MVVVGCVRQAICFVSCARGADFGFDPALLVGFSCLQDEEVRLSIPLLVAVLLIVFSTTPSNDFRTATASTP